MKFATLAFAAGALAAPAMQKMKRADLTDVQILNYALTLEHLENAFYRDGLALFGSQPFFDAGYEMFFYTNLMEISKDESVHVDFLTNAISSLGEDPVSECTYDFGYGNDVMTFLAIANVLEGVGITAYLGAAPFIDDPLYLTYAGAVLTVESRHSGYLRPRGYKPGRSPFPQPFDVPLTFNQVFTLASAFIVECPPDDPQLPLMAFPSLSVVGGPAVILPGSFYTVNAPDVDFSAGPFYAYYLTATGPVAATARAVQGDPNSLSVKAPSVASGIAGQSYLVITNSQGDITDDNTIAGPAVVPVRAAYIPFP